MNKKNHITVKNGDNASVGTNWRSETLGVRAGQGQSEISGDVAAAIHLTTTFHHGPAYELTSGYGYARDNSPNIATLENGLASLERGREAITFSSGVAAGAAMAQNLEPGTCVIFHHDTYLDFKNMVAENFSRWGLEAIFLDMCDDAKLRTQMEKARDEKRQILVWFETPSNPQLDIIDIHKTCDLVHQFNGLVLVDNTFASPVLQQPLIHGADIVLQSVTKYIGGHSDVMGGTLITNHDDLAERLRRYRKLTGGIMAPFSAWLAARGLQTLHCRMEKKCQSALAIAQFLQHHSAIDRVHYPGLKDNASYEIAKKQMQAFGAIVSFEMKAGAPAAINVERRVQLFTTATSIGGVESLIEHRASVEGDATNTPPGLLRASIGLEHVDDLISDLKQALQ